MDTCDVDGVNGDRQAVEERGVFIGDVVRQGEDVLGRRLRVLAEAAAPADADVLQLGTKVIVADLAVDAAVAGQERLDGDAIADLDAGDVGRHGDDLAAELVAEHFAEDARHDLGQAPRIEVEIAAADAGYGVLHQHFARAELRRGHVPYLERPRRHENRRAHTAPPMRGVPRKSQWAILSPLSEPERPATSRRSPWRDPYWHEYCNTSTGSRARLNAPPTLVPPLAMPRPHRARAGRVGGVTWREEHRRRSCGAACWYMRWNRHEPGS